MRREWSEPTMVAVERATVRASHPRVRRTLRVAAVVGSAAVIGALFTMALDHLGGWDQPTLKAPILALYRDDGIVFAEVAACRDDRVRSVVIEQLVTNGPDWTAGRVWAIVPGPAAQKVTRIRLFEVPSGWQVSAMHGRITDETALAPAGDYLVWIRTDGDDQAAFAFPVSRLDTTSPDSPLTSSGRDRADGEPDSTVMSRSGFDERVRRYCAEHHA